METIRWAEYELSRLALGTVQFGMRYGIANRNGQPSFDEVCSILRLAHESGVNCLDTASAYGTSEEVLGKALRELGLRERMVVVTKIAPASKPADVAASVELSLERLGLTCLPLVLFHREANMEYVGELERCCERGLVRHIGMSCDGDPESAAALIGSGRLKAVQVPASMLDRRNAGAGNFREAARRGMAVFIRSVYLQGLLLMPEESVPVPLRSVLPARRRLESLAKDAGMTLACMAVRYMLGQEGVTCVLAGVESAAQLRENIAMVKEGPLPADLIRAVEQAAPQPADDLIIPARWQANKWV